MRKFENTLWSEKFPFEEMSWWGECPVKEVSFREVSSRGIVRLGKCPLGKCPSGKCPSGKCQSGICPRGSVSHGTVQSGNCPTIQFDTYVVNSDAATSGKVKKITTLTPFVP